MENSQSEQRLETLFSQKDTDRIDKNPNAFCTPGIIRKPLQSPDPLEFKNDLPKNNQLTIKLPLQPNDENLKGSLEYIMRDSNLLDLPHNFSTTYFHLKSIDLRGNNFREIPTEIFSLFNLRILRMDDNLINSIPPGIGQLTCLQILTLSHNSIYYVHSSLGKLKDLTALILSDNSLEDWSSHLFNNLTNLRLLHLHGNPKIKGLPITFSCLDKLQEFSLDWFLYLPNSEKVLRGPDGLVKISETRRLCNTLSKLKDVHFCSFSQFIQHFVPSVSILQAEVYPLHLAAHYNHNHVIMEELIELVDINYIDEKGETALSIAIKERNKEGTKILLQDKRIDPNIYISHEGAAIHTVLKYGWLDVAEIIVNHPLFLPNTANGIGETCLHILFENYGLDTKRSDKIAESLMKNPETNPNARNRHELTPLHYAARKNQKECIKFCLNHNRNCSLAYHLFDFNAVGGNHLFSVLHYLVIYSTIEIISEVLNEDVDLFALDKYGRTPRDLLKNSIVGKLLQKREQMYRNKINSKDSISQVQLSILNEQTTKMPFPLENSSKKIRHIRKNIKSEIPAKPLSKLMPKKQISNSRNILQITPQNLLAVPELNFGNAMERIICNDTPKMSCRMMKKPMGINNGESFDDDIEVEEQFLVTHHKDIIQNIKLTKEERMILQNRYSEIYNLLVGNECTKRYKYKLLYYLLSRLDTDAEQILKFLSENNETKGIVNEDIQYLYNIFLNMKENYDGRCIKKPESSLKIHLSSIQVSPEKNKSELDSKSNVKFQKPYKKTLKLQSPNANLYTGSKELSEGGCSPIDQFL